MIKNVLSTFVCIWVLFFECCSRGNTNESTSKYQMKSFTKEFGECGSLSNYCVSVKINYPFFTATKNPVIKDSLNSQIDRMILQPVFEWKINSLEKLADSLIADYKKLKTEFPDIPIRYELERRINVILNKGNIISLEFKEYSFLGGAHPNSLMNFINLNIRTGQKIALDQLFKKGFEEELNLIGEKKFREARQLNLEDNLEKSGFWFKENKFSLTSNFLITQAGLKFFFNDYEVAPHAIGPTEIFISYNEIKYMINNEGLLSSFIE